MTNADKIKSMSNEQLADFLITLKYNCCEGKCGDCIISDYIDVEGNCSVEEWIEREYAE